MKIQVEKNILENESSLQSFSPFLRIYFHFYSCYMRSYGLLLLGQHKLQLNRRDNNVIVCFQHALKVIEETPLSAVMFLLIENSLKFRLESTQISLRLIETNS